MITNLPSSNRRMSMSTVLKRTKDSSRLLISRNSTRVLMQGSNHNSINISGHIHSMQQRREWRRAWVAQVPLLVEEV